MPGVADAVWRMFAAGAALHQQLVVEGADGDAEAPLGDDALDGDGEALALEAVASQARAAAAAFLCAVVVLCLLAATVAPPPADIDPQ